MPLTDFFLDYVPGYNKFRAVTIILVIVEMAAPVLGILYLDKLLKEGKWDKEKMRRFLIPAGILTALLVFVWLSPQTMFDMLSDKERTEFQAQISASSQAEASVTAYALGLKGVRADIFKADALRSLGFVLAAISLLFFYGRGALGRVVVISGLGLLILFDIWTVRAQIGKSVCIGTVHNILGVKHIDHLILRKCITNVLERRPTLHSYLKRT